MYIRLHLQLDNGVKFMSDMKNNGLAEDEVIEDFSSSVIPEEKSKNDTTKKNNSKYFRKILLGIIVALVLIGIGIYAKNNKEPDKHISVSDSTESKNDLAATNNGSTEAVGETDTEVVDSTEATDSEGIDEITKSNVVKSNVPKKTVKGTKSKPAKAGEWVKVPVTINTKLNDKASFDNYKSFVYLKMNKVVYGYDQVVEYINNYNALSDTVVGVDNNDKKDVKIAMYEFELVYDDKYPTYMSRDKIYAMPDLNLSLKGTVNQLDNRKLDKKKSSDYIVVGSKIYSVADATSITDKQVDETNGTSINNKIVYRFVVYTPKGANSDNYVEKLNIKIDKNKQDVYFVGQAIK